MIYWLEHLPAKAGKNFTNCNTMSCSLDKYSMKVGCKHPSTTLRVTVRLSVVEVYFR
jgi:hypothetical protein